MPKKLFYFCTGDGIIAAKAAIINVLWPDDLSYWPIIPFRFAAWYNGLRKTAE